MGKNRFEWEIVSHSKNSVRYRMYGALGAIGKYEIDELIDESTEYLKMLCRAKEILDKANSGESESCARSY